MGGTPQSRRVGPVDTGRGIATRWSRRARDRFGVRVRLGWSVLSSVLLGAGVMVSTGAGESAASAASLPTPSAPSVAWGAHGPHNDVCEDAFNGRAKGSLTKTTSAGPSGSTVLPDQTIMVNLTWNPQDLEGHSFSILDCVRIGSHISASLSQLDAPAPSGGTDTFRYAMPNGTNGQAVCDRAVLLRADGEGDGGQGDGGQGNGSGEGDGNSESEQGSANGQGNQGQQQHEDGGGTGSGTDEGSHGGDGGFAEKSAVFCYSIDPAVTPEVPFVILFPLAGLTVAGGSVLVHRRRHRPRPAT